MKIQNVFFAMLFMLVALSSCQKDMLTSSGVNIDVADLPTSAKNYVVENYPDTEIVSAVEIARDSRDMYIAILDSDEQITFDKDGDYLGGGDGSYFEGYKHGGGSNGHGNHGGGQGPGHGHGHHHHLDGIPLDSLSATITDYVTANYPDYTIRFAANDSTCQFGNIIRVFAGQQGVGRVSLGFATDGTYLFSSERSHYDELPQAIQDAVTALYPDYEARNRAAIITLADGSLQYVVFLHNDAGGLKVTLAADGSLVCEG